VASFFMTICTIAAADRALIDSDEVAKLAAQYAAHPENKKSVSTAIDVRKFGAKGDGIADDTAAFEEAKKQGRNLYLPSGTYRVNLSLDGRTSIHGDSRRATFLKPANSNLPVIVMDTANSSEKDFAECSDLTIDCEGATASVGISLGAVKHAGNSRNNFRNILIRNADRFGLWIRDATSCLFENINIEDGKGYGIYIDPERNTQVCEFINCQTRQNRVGAFLASGNRYVFIGCDFESNRETGLYVERRLSSGFAYSTFISCWLENNGHNPSKRGAPSNASVYLDAVESATNAANLILQTCMIASAAGAYDVYARRAQNVLFDRCSFSTASLGGFSSNKFQFADERGLHVMLRQCGELNKGPSPALYALFPGLARPTTGSTSDGPYGFFYEYDFGGRWFTNRRIFGLGMSPVDVLAPAFVGEVVSNDRDGMLYVAKGLTEKDWNPVNARSGAFTPTIAGSISAGTTTYDKAVGTFLKVGKALTASGLISFKGYNGEGSMLIRGLPFAAEAGGVAPFPAVIMAEGIGKTNLVGRLQHGRKEIEITTGPETGGSPQPIAQNGTIVFSVTYRTN
jgi:hypothetical protein